MPLTPPQALELLTVAHENHRLGHALLITGSSGVGKRVLASQVIGMLHPKEGISAPEIGLFGEVESAALPEEEVKELEALQSEYVRIVQPRSRSRIIRVEEMRGLEDSFYLSAPRGQWKVGVIIDADRMNDAAANAFLKTLEEPPPNCLLLLLTTAPDRLLTTILSRCVSIPLYDPQKSGWSELQQDLYPIFAKALGGQKRAIAVALSLKADFDGYLKGKKEELAKKHKGLLKEEMQQLKQVTDRGYLKEKEEESKAKESSEYLGMRSASMDALVIWMGNVFRWKVGGIAEEMKVMEEAFESFASDLSIYELQQRLAALEELRFLLMETNVSEALALESCFMRAFA